MNRPCWPGRGYRGRRVTRTHTAISKNCATTSRYKPRQGRSQCARCKPTAHWRHTETWVRQDVVLTGKKVEAAGIEPASESAPPRVYHARLRRILSNSPGCPPTGVRGSDPGKLSSPCIRACRGTSLDCHAPTRRPRQGSGGTALDRFLGGQRELDVVVGSCGFCPQY